MVWGLVLGAFFLLGAAWALALPINGTYDESQHIVRAYAVADGQLLPSGRGEDAAGLPAETFDAPRGLLPDRVNCTWSPKPPKPASCQRPARDDGRAPMPSQAARYAPVYYALVGWPLLASPDMTGVVVSRLLSALLSASLLAASVMIASRYGDRLLAAGVALVCTPMVMNLAGAVNPNGLEIAAGILLFVSLLALLRPRRNEAPLAAERGLGAAGGGRLAVDRLPLAAAAVAGVLLITIRQFGPVLFAGVVLACLLVARPGRPLALLRHGALWRWFAVPVAAAVGFAGWWFLYSRFADLTVPDKGFRYGVGETLWRLPGERFRFYAEQIVGRFSYGETTVSPLLIVAWFALFAAIVVPGLLWGGARIRLAICGVFLACLGILVALELYFVPTFGWFSHSRYVAPLGVGVVLLAATGDRTLGELRDRGWLGLPVTLVFAATVPLDLYALLRVMSRFQIGIAAAPNPFGGSWDAPLGPLPPLLSMIVGAVALVIFMDRSAGSGGLRFWRRSAWQTESAVNDREVVARKDELG